MSDDHLREVIGFELGTLAPDIRLDATKMDGLFDQDFCEIGAHGTVLASSGRLEALAEEDAGQPPIDVAEMGAQAVSSGLVLVTYDSSRPGRPARQGPGARRAEAPLAAIGRLVAPRLPLGHLDLGKSLRAGLAEPGDGEVMGIDREAIARLQ